MTRTTSPIAKRVDHIMVRVVDSAYDQLFSFLTRDLQLPQSWPVMATIPGFKTGGVFAGNISMEIFQSGTQQTLSAPVPIEAQLYGIAFEPYDLTTVAQEVDRRGMAHLPLIPVPQGYPFGTLGSMWTLLFFDNLLAPDLSHFQAVMKGARDLSPFFGEQVFRNGMVFLCEYDKTFYDTTQGRLNRLAELQAKHGGPLGLETTQAIVVGARDIEAAHKSWQRLFDPLDPTAPGVWQIGDGPAIMLVPHPRDGLVRLVWKVTSLPRAREFLNEQGIACAGNDKQVTIDPAALFGLDIYLVD